MRTSVLVLAVVSLLGLSSAMVWGQGAGGGEKGLPYDACSEQFYDAIDEPCGGGHVHGANRNELELARSRHRHRFLEEHVRKLEESVGKLRAEVEALRKAAAK